MISYGKALLIKSVLCTFRGRGLVVLVLVLILIPSSWVPGQKGIFGHLNDHITPAIFKIWSCTMIKRLVSVCLSSKYVSGQSIVYLKRIKWFLMLGRTLLVVLGALVSIIPTIRPPPTSSPSSWDWPWCLGDTEHVKYIIHIPDFMFKIKARSQKKVLKMQRLLLMTTLQPRINKDSLRVLFKIKEYL